MAAGDLSTDQERYVATVAARTGLDPVVVRSWVGAESGWGTTKPGHNYLNIGPGRQFVSTDIAAAAAANLVNESDHYREIRAAIPAGGAAQVKAIGSSPWGTASGLLEDVWRQLTGNPGIKRLDELGKTLSGNNGLDGLGDLGGAAADVLGLDKVAEQVLVAGLSLVFVAASFGLVAMGLARLTDKTAKELYGQVAGVVGMASGTKGLAAAAGAVA